MAHPSTFYPRRTKTPTQKRRHTGTQANRNAHKHHQNPSFFAAPHILRVPIRRSPSRRFKSDLQLNPTLSPSFYAASPPPPLPPSSPAGSTCSIEIPIAALSKALYDEGSQATRALSAVFTIFHVYYHISGIPIHYLSSSLVIINDKKRPRCPIGVIVFRDFYFA